MILGQTNARQYGYWLPYIQQVINRYLHCDDLHNGFARHKMSFIIGNPHLNSKPKTFDL